MKIIKSLAAATVLSVFAIGSASAITLDQVTSSTNLNITIDSNGVATLFGNVDSSFEKYQAAQAAAKIEGVESVRNLLTFSN